MPLRATSAGGPGQESVLFQCPLSGRCRCGRVLKQAEERLEDGFQCPLSGRCRCGYMTSSPHGTPPALLFQCPLSGRCRCGFQQLWYWLVDSFFLFQCPLSGRCRCGRPPSGPLANSLFCRLGNLESLTSPLQQTQPPRSRPRNGLPFAHSCVVSQACTKR